MRLLYPLLTLLLAVIVTASPNPVGNKEPRMAIQVKPVAGAEGQKPVGGIEDTANYVSRAGPVYSAASVATKGQAGQAPSARRFG